ncbi:ABC-type tungstate transport system, periplasmic component [SAR116 cluster alpha proteobacterium HIMB100]|nr:ABC-type tungstate transport system, periplasmic component [SAR116 cluster alpha proteobacterium HIMB100]
MDFFTPFVIAVQMLAGFDASLYEIIGLSLQVSLVAVGAALMLGLPLGAVLASFQFTGRTAVVVVTNTLLSLPPVVVGLVVYLLISRTGPLGFLDLLYSPAAMMMAQFILVLPLSVALSRQVFEGLHQDYDLLFQSLNLSWRKRVVTLLADGKAALVTIALVCFGRAISEVGAVILVGGNIKHVTRVMTSAIALETARGELAFALALGLVLLFISLLVNIISHQIRSRFEQEGRHG